MCGLCVVCVWCVGRVWVVFLWYLCLGRVCFWVMFVFGSCLCLGRVCLWVVFVFVVVFVFPFVLRLCVCPVFFAFVSCSCSCSCLCLYNTMYVFGRVAYQVTALYQDKMKCSLVYSLLLYFVSEFGHSCLFPLTTIVHQKVSAQLH